MMFDRRRSELWLAALRRLDLPRGQAMTKTKLQTLTHSTAAPPRRDWPFGRIPVAVRLAWLVTKLWRLGFGAVTQVSTQIRKMGKRAEDGQQFPVPMINTPLITGGVIQL